MMQALARRSTALYSSTGRASLKSAPVLTTARKWGGQGQVVGRRWYCDAKPDAEGEEAVAVEEAAEAAEEAEVAVKAPRKVYSNWRDYPVKTVEDCEAFLAAMSRKNLRSMAVSERQQFFDKRDLAKTKIKKVRDQEQFMELSDWVFEEVHEYYYANSAHPVINPVLKENMYRSWVKDPEYWTLDKLAQKFRVKKLTAEAIVMLKVEEKRLMKVRSFIPASKSFSPTLSLYVLSMALSLSCLSCLLSLSLHPFVQLLSLYVPVCLAYVSASVAPSQLGFYL